MRVMLQTICTTAVLAAATAAAGQDQMPWQPNLETAQRVAAQTNRLVLVHFWAPWCRPCMQLESNVFSNRQTAQQLEANYVFVKLNADRAAAERRRFGVSSLPTDVIITPDGTLVAQLQSPPTVPQYVSKMNQAAAGHRSLARKPEVQPVKQPDASQQTAPPSNAGAMHDPYAAPTAEVAGPPADRYAEYFPESGPSQPQPGSAQHPVKPAQAYAAAPSRPAPPSATVDPYATNPAPATPTADSRYAQSAPPQQGQAPLVDPYADPPAGAQPPGANPYAGGPAPSAAQQPPVQQPPVQQPPAQQPQAQPPITPPPVAGPYGAPPQGAPQGAAPQTPPGYGAQQAARPQVNLPQLPPGCPPVGLEGNCPVTLLERKRWAVGNAAFGAVHRGRTYLFLGPQEKEKFLADPDRYSPVMSGLDPIHALEGQQAVPGKREYGVFGADGHVYLFADEATRSRFEQNEQYYTQRVQQAAGGAPAAGAPTYQAMRPPGR
ncbi:MAG: DUF255 domain-containing protein [Planctomycetota bacterium]|nr:MAG: DUF255 domain-containing protein [Planctomycetota bacterium]